MLDVLRHGEREVVETVCLIIFSFISLKKDQASSLNEKGGKAVVLGSESSDTEIKNAFEGTFKVGHCHVGFEYRSQI